MHILYILAIPESEPDLPFHCTGPIALLDRLVGLDWDIAAPGQHEQVELQSCQLRSSFAALFARLATLEYTIPEVFFPRSFTYLPLVQDDRVG